MEKHFEGRDFFDRNRFAGSGLISHVGKIDNLLPYPAGAVYIGEGDNKIVFSLLNSDNIKVQQGSFVFNATPFIPLEQIALNNYEADIRNYKFCECYNINKLLVPFIKNKLNELGISKEYLYPDGGGDVNASDIFSTVISI